MEEMFENMLDKDRNSQTTLCTIYKNEVEMEKYNVKPRSTKLHKTLN
jgi:hypothetical protein